MWRKRGSFRARVIGPSQVGSDRKRDCEQTYKRAREEVHKRSAREYRVKEGHLVFKSTSMDTTQKVGLLRIAFLMQYPGRLFCSIHFRGLIFKLRQRTSNGPDPFLIP